MFAISLFRRLRTLFTLYVTEIQLELTFSVDFTQIKWCLVERCISESNILNRVVEVVVV